MSSLKVVGVAHNALVGSVVIWLMIKNALKSPGAVKCLQYHEACLKEHTYQEVASNTWFCGESCQEVYSGLQSRIRIVNLLSDECNSKLAVDLETLQSVLSPENVSMLHEFLKRIMRGRREYYEIDSISRDGTAWLKKPPFEIQSRGQPGGACSEGGRIDDLTRQLDGSSSPKEVAAQMETRHTDGDGNNMQVVRDEDATLHEHFSKLCCE
ncbi:unnamed protein product [Camellia sinensis]